MELPDFTFKGMVNLDTPISEINEKKSQYYYVIENKFSSHVYHLLHPKNILQKQFIKITPCNIQHNTTFIGQLQSNFTLNDTFQR